MDKAKRYAVLALALFGAVALFGLIAHKVRGGGASVDAG